jgi:SAM-dependent methyltransferase
MTGWNSGYVTDVPYSTGYYRQQTPQHMAVACLLGGAAGAVPRPDEPVSYLELGCGQGLTSLMLAACNPAWRVTAVDFSPLHVAEARALAAEAGIGNVTYLEADLAGLADGPGAAAVPEADFCSMHGVWTWVGPAVRAGIVRLLASKLAPGGVLHVSTNSLPGWQSALGLRRLIREAAVRAPGRSDRSVRAGLALARDLAEAGAQNLGQTRFVTQLMERLPGFDPEYLAHEYMHTDANPCFHADLCADLAAAKLEWAGTCSLFEAFPELTLTPEQRAIHDRAEDPVMRELIKDMCLLRSLRHDVFVRGARRIGAAARDAALADVTLALTAPPEAFNYEADFPSGRATLNRDFYGPMVARLAEAPMPAGALCATPDGARRSSPGEVVAMLVGTNQAASVNRTLSRRLARPDTLGGMTAFAAPRAGAGVGTRIGDLFVIDGLRDGLDPEDAPAWEARLGGGLGPAQQADLHKLVMHLATHGPGCWRALGALDQPAAPR